MRTNRLFQQKIKTRNNQVQPVTTVTIIGTGTGTVTGTGTKKKKPQPVHQNSKRNDL